MNPLLKNAVVSIQLGLEDFASDDERRIISAARNLYSGVLLLATIAALGHAFADAGQVAA